MAEAPTSLDLLGLLPGILRRFESAQLGQDFKNNFASCIIQLEVIKICILRWSLSARTYDTSNLTIYLGEGPSDNAWLAPSHLYGIIQCFAHAQDDSITYQERQSRTMASNEFIEMTAALDEQNELRLADPGLSHTFRALQKITSNYQAMLGQTSELTRTKWVVHERSRFTVLIDHLSKFATNLERLIPSTKATEQTLVEDEVKQLDKTVVDILLDLKIDSQSMFQQALQNATKGHTYRDVKVAGNEVNHSGFEFASAEAARDAGGHTYVGMSVTGKGKSYLGNTVAPNSPSAMQQEKQHDAIGQEAPEDEQQ